MAIISLKLTGETPAKKNRWAIGRHGKIYLPADVKNWNTDVLWQIKAQTRNKIKLQSKKLGLKADIYVQRVKDLDNLLSSIMDALQQSGVIANDNRIVEIHAMRYKADKLQRPHVDLSVYDML